MLKAFVRYLLCEKHAKEVIEEFGLSDGYFSTFLLRNESSSICSIYECEERPTCSNSTTLKLNEDNV